MTHTRTRQRGMALIFVLLLLTIVLYLALSFLVRGNSNLFTVTRDEVALQSFSFAEALAHQMATAFHAKVKEKGNVDEALDAAVAIMKNDATGPAIYDATGKKIVGYQKVRVYDATGTALTNAYADVSYRKDSPHSEDKSSTFGSGAYALPYVTVTFQAVGYLGTLSGRSRASRTVEERYNVVAGESPVFNFAYFMDNWAWWSGFAPSQARLMGNTGANGNYDILAGYLQAYGGPTLEYGGADYNEALYTQLEQRDSSDGVSGIYGNLLGQAKTQQAEYFASIITPDLSRVTDASGPYAAVATGTTARTGASGTTVNTPGTIKVQTVRVQVDSSGGMVRSPSSGNVVYTPVSSPRTVVSSGVYPQTSSQKENLVLGSAPGTAAGYYNVDMVIIDGPVVVKGDVVMQGLVKGRGSLYTGRNLYVGGDLQYANPPSTSPGITSNGYYATTKDPKGTYADANTGQAATQDYKTDQVMLASAGNIVAGDVTNKTQWWDGAVSPWLDWQDPVSGKKVSGDKQYDYNADFAFRNGFNSANFDNFPSGVTSYSQYVKPATRIDGFLLSSNAIAGFFGKGQVDYSGYRPNKDVTFFGGQIAKQDAQIINSGYYATNQGWKGYGLNVYQDKRFLNSDDLGVPDEMGRGAMMAPAEWWEP